MFRKLTITILICFLTFSIVNSQSIKIQTYGVSARTVDADTNDIFDLKYNGLANVGVGTKIYLAGMAVDTTFNSPDWNISVKPNGSNVSILATEDLNETTKIIALIPDVPGTYKIQFNDGSLTSEITINSANFIGTPSKGLRCDHCHTDYYTEWQGTAHANAVQPQTDNPDGHFQSYCLSCHTTGYDLNASNNGFDDFEFEFPSTLQPGNYDSLLVKYPLAMERANVQCEACHGPGSNHNGLIADSKIVMSQASSTCAYCHDAGTHHAIPAQLEDAGLDATEFDGRGFHGGHTVGAFVGYAGGRAACAPCHSGAGYVQWIKEGRPSDDLGLPAAVSELPEATNFTCVTCHDPHNGENPHQLRAKETTLGDGTVISFDIYGTGAQCMDCHRSRRQASTYAEDIENGSAHFGAHHGPQADMLLGKNAPDYGIEFPSSPHGVAGGNACVDCHMAGESGVDENGEVVNFGGHTFNMNTEEGEDNVGACNVCHGEVGETFKEKKFYVNSNADLDGNGIAEGLQVEVHGLLEELAQYLPKDTEGNVLIQSTADFSNAVDDSLTPRIMKAGYVYFFVEEDRSFGIHNPQYTVAMLKAAIDEVGGVTGITYENNQLPTEYKLAQNYPNPFNPITVINFSIPETGNVKLAIYDALGREVEVIVDELMNAGNYNADWNATNYAAGIYFYNITVNDFVSTKKMVLLK